MALLRIIYRAWNDIPPWCKHRRAYMAQDAAFLRTPRKALISSGQEEVPGFTMYPTLWRADYWAFYLKVPAQHFTHVPLIVGYVESFRCRAPVATFDSETSNKTRSGRRFSRIFPSPTDTDILEFW